MYDITWCTYIACPIKKCERHMNRLKKLKKKNFCAFTQISVADYAGTCEDYLKYVLEQIEKEKKDEI